MTDDKDELDSLKKRYRDLERLYSNLLAEKRLIDKDRYEMRAKLRDLEEEVERLRTQKKKYDRSIDVKEEQRHEKFLEYLESPDVVDRLKNVVNVSNKIQLDMLQNILKIPEENRKYFDIKIFEWANKFGFTIDGDHLSFETDSMLEFIKMLKQKFEEWENREKLCSKG